MRILGLPGDSGACSYYRVEKPLEALAEAGLAEFYIPPIKDGNRLVRIGDFTEEEKKEIIEKQGGWDGFAEIRRFEQLPNVLDYDLLLFQRQPNEDIYHLIRRAQACGIKAIFDIDDDAFNIPATNPNYLMWGRDGRKVALLFLAMKRGGNLPPQWAKMAPQEVVANAKKVRDGLFRNIRTASLITTTTPALATAYRKVRTGMAILPNQMDPGDWEGVEPIVHRGEIWLGWAGSKTHHDDLKLLERVIPTILERHPRVSFVIAGFPEAKKRLFDGYPDHRVITFPWTDMRSYREYLASFDIVLAPSYPNKFNAGKSDIRVLEAGMVWRPVVGSPTTYGATIRESEGGFVAKRPIQWIKALGQLIEDGDLRRTLGQNLGNYARDRRTYQANAPLWAKAYSDLLEAPCL